MRNIKYIVVHCTGTDTNVSPSAISNYWRNHLGWKNPGYHYMIDATGNLTILQQEEKIANGVKGHNRRSVHVSYIGGKKKTLKLVIDILKNRYPKAEIKGHCDFKGVLKTCPNFDVKKDYG
jgi:N-acetylmuramoyl-L-alanine amidase